MSPTVDTVVIGGGAMGSAAAWALSRAGEEVTLLERFEPGHRHGASHGATRNFSLGYTDPTYLAMLREAVGLWKEIEADAGETLFASTGVVSHGADHAYPAVAEALTASGLRAEFLSLAEAGERWTGIRFDRQVLWMPDGGQLNADAAVLALQRIAASRGAIIHHRARVVELDVRGDDEVRVAVEGDRGTEVLSARRVVVAAGAWTDALLGGRVPLPRLTVTQEQPAHFAVVDRDAAWPGFNHRFTPGEPGYEYWYSAIYGMLTPGEGVKTGWHAVGPLTDPDHRSFRPDPVQLGALRRYVREWLPGADPDAFADISCTYTLTPDENFVIDRIGPVVVAAGFSGHGFKFTPAVGRMLADLARGTATAPALFRADRVAAGSLFRIPTTRA